MLTYTNDLDSIEDKDLSGFFVGWPTKPDQATFQRLLGNSQKVVLAIDNTKLVGFITAITDQTLSAYITFLEVLPQNQLQGIGKELVARMLLELEDYYMIDLVCNAELAQYYQQFGLQKSQAMSIRKYNNQGGIKNID
jgi:ribosomal protein S18 acetylase RimI-like enzyme